MTGSYFGYLPNRGQNGAKNHSESAFLEKLDIKRRISLSGRLGNSVLPTVPNNSHFCERNQIGEICAPKTSAILCIHW